MSTCLYILQIDIAPELRLSPNLYEDWMLLVFFITLLNIAYVRIAYKRRLQRLFSSLLRLQILRQVMREELVFSHRASVLLFLNFVLLSSLLGYLAFKFYGWLLPMGLGLSTYLIFVMFVALLYFGKLILVRFLRWLFADHGLMREYLFEVFLVNKVIGLVGLPIALALTFLNVAGLHPIFLALAALIFMSLMFRTFQGLLIAAAYPVSRIYIILYLCTLELLPFLVIIKALQREMI